MELNKITEIIVDTGFSIHSTLGPGLLESAYESIFAFELAQRGLGVERQVPIPVLWKGMLIDEGFRADLIVEKRVIVELKSVERIAALHKKQVLTYLRISGLKVGLLINFGSAYFKDGISRIVNGLEEGM
ncbi:MAG: GxxExxY protein [Spirochaetes bacterium]|nr:GxxExxY protein [Spirochaetota bacterium]